MTAIIGGVGASLCWAISALCATVASRSIGADSTIAWIMTLGLAMVAPFVLLFASVDELTPRTIGLLATAGITNIIGLFFLYRAFRIGKVGVVTAIASTEGMAAALIAMLAGEPISAGVFLVLVVLTIGVVLAAADRNATTSETSTDLKRLLVLATPVPVVLGIGLFAAGELGSNISLLWATLPSRLAGVAFVAAPMAARGTLQIKRAVLPLVALAGLVEVLGYAAYTWGSRENIAVAAVLGGEYAALAAAGAYLLLGERLDRRQLLGLALVAIGVAALAIVQG